MVSQMKLKISIKAKINNRYTYRLWRWRKAARILSHI